MTQKAFSRSKAEKSRATSARGWSKTDVLRLHQNTDKTNTWTKLRFRQAKKHVGNVHVARARELASDAAVVSKRKHGMWFMVILNPA